MASKRVPKAHYCFFFKNLLWAFILEAVYKNILFSCITILISGNNSVGTVLGISKVF